MSSPGSGELLLVTFIAFLMFGTELPVLLKQREFVRSRLPKAAIVVIPLVISLRVFRSASVFILPVFIAFLFRMVAPDSHLNRLIFVLLALIPAAMVLLIWHVIST